MKIGRVLRLLRTCCEPYPTPNIFEQDIGPILKMISFVDRIVFGKWNYNSDSSAFAGAKRFYNDAAHEVARFCHENDIECHIKEGTINWDLVKDKSTTSYLRAYAGC